MGEQNPGKRLKRNMCTYPAPLGLTSTVQELGAPSAEFLLFQYPLKAPYKPFAVLGAMDNIVDAVMNVFELKNLVVQEFHCVGAVYQDRGEELYGVLVTLIPDAGAAYRALIVPYDDGTEIRVWTVDCE